MPIVAKYNLNGDANAQVGSNGTATNVTWVNGKMNQAGSFNGSNSKINVPQAGPINNFTVRVWATRGDADSLVVSFYNAYISFTSNGNPGVNYYDGSADRYIETTLGITDNNFHRIAWVKSSTDGQSLYVDGVLKGTQASTSNLSTSYNSNIGIGYFRTFNGNYHNGRIDEVEIFNHTHTPAEIKNDFLYYNGFI